MAIFTKSSSSYSIKSGGKPDNQLKIEVDLLAVKDHLGGTKVKMATHANSLSGANDFSLSSSSKIQPGPDNYDLKIDVGDWAQEKSDQGALDFLICISGAKSGKPPVDHVKNPSDIDVRVDLNLGRGLEVAFTPDSLKGLKLVKCKDADGDLAWGYVGKVSDSKKIKMALNSEKSGKKLANMNIDLSVDEKDDDDGPPIKFPFDPFDPFDPFGSL